MAKPNAHPFSERLLSWFDQFGRHDLPWQQNINPYRVWVSEIMLQQTQVKTVIPYFEKFMTSFPTLADLAAASQEAVLSHWAGLGYYARGRNLHKAAQIIMQQHNGQFPADFDAIVALPGIGRSTAGAVLSIALNQRYAILDGNVKRVLARYFAVEGWPGEKTIEKSMWQLAEDLTPQQRFNDYTQAIMDLGATLCTRSKPSCEACPVQSDCQAFKLGLVSQYPYKKPKKDKPTKQAWLLLQEDQQGQIYLQKRPQKGIWGGLWSLPEFESLQSCQESLQSQRRLVKSLLEWPSFRHTFSHYHLEIYPVHCTQHFSEENQAEPSSTKLNENLAMYASQADIEGRWIGVEALLKGEVGVPAPVLKLVEQLHNNKPAKKNAKK